MLEKTLECSLDSKEIKPVNLKGNQCWIFTASLMLKLKLQYCGHLKRTTDTLEKTLMLGKIEGRRGWQRMSCMASLMQWTWTGANSGRWWGTGKPDMLHSMGFIKNGTQLVTEQKQHLTVCSISYFVGKQCIIIEMMLKDTFLYYLWSLIRVYIACVRSPLWIFVTPLTAGHQAPLSM